MQSVTLRIKKHFYQQIELGFKKVEYREYKEFYKRVLKKDKSIKRIRFHYQSGDILISRVKFIRVINKPKFLKNSKLVKTNKVFQIVLY